MFADSFLPPCHSIFVLLQEVWVYNAMSMTASYVNCTYLQKLVEYSRPNNLRKVEALALPKPDSSCERVDIDQNVHKNCRISN